MLRLVRFCVSDRPCIALGVALIVSLAVAHLADRPVASAIPEHHLGRIRGTNQNFTEVSDGSCTTVNVNSANNMNPPPPPGTVYIADGSCNAATVGFPCLFCGIGPGFTTYRVESIPSANGVRAKPVQLVACMTDPPGSGTIGTCDPFFFKCLDQRPYDCNTTGAKWAYQNGTSPP